jgi:2-polyprenyl-3-methyl-5-hydroxy-6-metoxy-1,4-benzoquinol methylase
MAEQPLFDDPMTERIFRSELAVFEVLGVFLGERLGLYRSLAEHGPATSTEVAARTGTVERLVREWLEEQAATGYLEVAEPEGSPGERRYALPAAHLAALVERDGPAYRAHAGVDMVRGVLPMLEVLRSYRTGEAPTFPPIEEGAYEFNRARFANHLAGWLGAIPEVDGRLRGDPRARVADLGCGLGFSTLALVTAYPMVQVDGIDLDPDAVAMAAERARGLPGADRVRFRSVDAADLAGEERYDLVTIFEALHDMARPVEALAAARALLGPQGKVLVADERVAEEFSVPAPVRDRYAYGWSMISCLPAALEPGSAQTGAVMRPATLRRYAAEAGFADVVITGVEDPLWRFYLLMP